MQMPELTFFRTLTRPKSSYKTVVITFGVRLISPVKNRQIRSYDRILQYGVC